MLASVLAFACTAFPNPGIAAPQQSADPVAVVLTYSVRPRDRSRFRELMRTQGISQLQHWEKQGVFRSYQAFFGSRAGAKNPDMVLVLRFDHFADATRWREIEEKDPSWLTATANSRATLLSTDVADIVSERTVAVDTPASQILAIEYDVLVDSSKYRDYVHGYVVPQFEGWEKAGALTSYLILANRNPAGAPWSSLILLHYRDARALGERDQLKDRLRAELATTNSAWKQWSEAKTAVRREKAILPLRSLDR